MIREVGHPSQPVRPRPRPIKIRVADRVAGRTERVNHRSFERQGVDRDAGRHFGPAAAYMASKGLDHERLTDSAHISDQHAELRALNTTISELERERANLVEIGHLDREDDGDGSAGGGKGGRGDTASVDRDDDWMPGGR